MVPRSETCPSVSVSLPDSWDSACTSTSVSLPDSWDSWESGGRLESGTTTVLLDSASDTVSPPSPLLDSRSLSLHAYLLPPLPPLWRWRFFPTEEVTLFFFLYFGSSLFRYVQVGLYSPLCVSPRRRRARKISLGRMVTLLAWMAQMFVSSKRRTK